MEAINALALLASQSVHASETPKDRYELDEACLATREAASELPDLYEKERSDADTMKQLYAKRIESSAHAVGINSDQVAQSVEKYRKSFASSLKSPDPEKAKKEQADLAKTLQRCEALPVFEIIDRGSKSDRE